MKKPLPRMYQDANEPAAVRDLLEAAVRTEANYDVDRGIATHLAHIEAGTAAPGWASQMLGEGARAGAGTAVGAGGGSMAGWLAGTVVAAAIVVGAAVQTMNQDERDARITTRVTIPATPSAAPADAQEDAQGYDAVRAANERARQEGLIAAAKQRARKAARVRPGERVSRPARPARAARHERPAAPREDVVLGSDDLRGARSQTSGVNATTAGAAELDRIEPGDSLVTSRAGGPQASTSGVTSGRNGPLDPVPELMDSTPEEELPTPPREQAKKPAPPEPEPVLPEDDSHLEREMRMLKVAQEVLVTNPERALRLARQGEQEFSGSLFTQERQAVLILALVRLDRMPEARRTAASYLRKYPRGPFSDRVRKALAKGASAP